MEKETLNNQNLIATVKNKKAILIAFVIFFVILTIGITSFFVLSDKKVENNLIQATNSSLPIATLSFLPGENLGAGVGQIQSVYILIDTQGREISSGVISLLYDPKAIGNVVLTQIKDPESALSSSFEQGEIYNSKKDGVVSLSLKIANTTPLQKGKGKIAKLSFVRLNTKTAIIIFGSNTGFISRNSNALLQLTKSKLTLQMIDLTPTP